MKSQATESRQQTPTRSLETWRRRYEDWYTQISEAHDSLGHPYGFNPVPISSVESFEASPRIMLATLNPGGNEDQLEHRRPFRYETENAYFVDWDGRGFSRIQLQVQAALELLRTRLGFEGSCKEFARANVVTTQLVPFRSPGEDRLHRKEESFRFCLNFWSRVFEHWTPEIVVSIGNRTTKLLEQLLGRVSNTQTSLTGWGQIQMKLIEFENGTRLLGLPHLSRFPIFGRPQGEQYLNDAFDWLAPGRYKSKDL